MEALACATNLSYSEHFEVELQPFQVNLTIDTI
ncbi:hypothetical protein FVEN_g12639 [Fusarium venenatum]|nr:hypothetical protein FVEN_g12639 [Fusarium venenatum]